MFAVLVGTIVRENDTITEIRVEDIAYPPVEATEDYVTWNPNDVVRFQALILPRQVVGTLHSHPESEPHLSKQDIESSHELGEVVFGVFSWWQPQGGKVRRTSFDWYSGLRRMEVEVLGE